MLHSTNDGVEQMAQRKQYPLRVDSTLWMLLRNGLR